MLSNLINRFAIGVQRHKPAALNPANLFFCFLAANAFKCSLVYVSCNHDLSFPFLILNYLASFILALIAFAGVAATGWTPLFAGFYLLQSVYLFINVCYFNMFNSPLHINYYYTLFWEFISISNKLIAVPMANSLLMSFLDLPLCIIILFIIRSFPLVYRLTFRQYLAGLIVASLALLSVLFITESISSVKLKTVVKMKPSAYDSTMLKRYGILGYNLFDIFWTKDEKQALVQLNYGRNIESRGNSQSSPNIIMIQVESLDANMIDFAWHGQFVMPFLHDLSRKSLYFPYMLSYHFAGGSSDCEISVLNSVEPLNSFPTMTSKKYDYPNSLAKTLRDQGMKTLMFHGNNGDYYNRNQAYFKMAFNRFHDKVRMNLLDEGWGASDRRVFEFAERKLDRERVPFFSYFITMSSHEPFTNTRGYFRDNSFDDVKHDITRRYFESIRYVDGALRDFVAHIKAKHPNSYIFIYGDHTPFVLKDGFYHRAAFELDNKELEFVPLLIVTPKNSVRLEMKKAVSYLDLAPTVLAASGVPFRYRTSGENLLKLTPERPIQFLENIYPRAMLYQKARDTAN